MQCFHFVKILGFLSSWTFLCWIFFAGEKNISTQVRVISDATLSHQDQELVLRQRTVLNLDRSERLNESSIVGLIQSLMPNVPIQLWHENKEKHWFSKTSCGRFPNVFDLRYNSKYWQQFDTPKSTMFLLNAYLDVRKAAKTPNVRILGMFTGNKESVHCQLWFRGEKEPVVTMGSIQDSMLYGDQPKPFILHCPLPESHQNLAPASVSLVVEACDVATNNLRVVFNQLPENQTKKDFAVCVKGLDFPQDDLSVRLVEWFELLAALGAEKIFLYNLEVHPNVTKVLEHYSNKGFIDVAPITLPGWQPNLPFLQTLFLKNRKMNRRQYEILIYNDCLYRNMYRFKYIAVLDIDEVIVPKKHTSWSAMMEEVLEASSKDPKTISWHFRHVYFIDRMTEDRIEDQIKDLTKKSDEKFPPPVPFYTSSIPEHLHMMNHVFRSANHSKGKDYTKSFIDPEKALIVFNHYPLASVEGAWTSHEVDLAVGHLHHYRSYCVDLVKDCEGSYLRHTVKDTSVWAWKDPVVRKSADVLHKLGFL